MKCCVFRGVLLVCISEVGASRRGDISRDVSERCTRLDVQGASSRLFIPVCCNMNSNVRSDWQMTGGVWSACGPDLAWGPGKQCTRKS